MLEAFRETLALWIAPNPAAITNRYEGAWPSPDRSFVPAALQPARQDISACTRRELQRRSRYWEKNSAYANRMGDLVEQYTVGTGLVLQPDSSSPEFNQAASEYFTEWSKAPDIGSNWSFGKIQSIIARTFFFDGEHFVLKVRGPDGSPKIQLVEGDMVNTPPDKVDGEGLADGVILNSFGRPTGYYIGSTSWEKGAPVTTYRPVGQEFVIAVMEPGRTGQNRGLPYLYPVLNDLHDLEDLQMLEMQAAKSAAEKTEIITTSTGEVTAAQLRAARFGVVKPADGKACPPQDAGTYYNTVFGGRAKVVRTGDKYEQFVGQRPSDATRQYWRLLEEKICIGVGIPFVVVSPDTMQGTVFRGALDMANSFFRSRWQVLAESFAEIYAYALEGGRAKVPALRDPPADWRNVAVHPPRSVNVDVGRNSSAMLGEYSAGTTNLRAIYAEQGQNWKPERRQWFEERAYDLELQEEFGVPAPAIGSPLPPPGEEPTPPDPETLQEILEDVQPANNR